MGVLHVRTGACKVVLLRNASDNYAKSLSYAEKYLRGERQEEGAFGHGRRYALRRFRSFVD